jgi:leader peptidase (prepilin peptidase) / N-methyltransferase
MTRSTRLRGLLPRRVHILTDSVSVLISIFAMLAGLAFGSFLNVCISRLPHHVSVVTPRSRCPRCLTPILNRDNVPVLSWVLLHGRCRACGARIPLRYPLIEAATAVLFLLCFLEFGLTLRGVASAVLCWLLLGLAATDAETLLLPDTLTLPGLALGAVYSGFRYGDGFLLEFHWREAAESLLWAAGAAALILVIRGLYWLVRRREGIGLGDAKLLAMLAAWLGPWLGGLVLLLAVICAAAYGIGLIAWTRRSRPDGGKLTARIPLGAFLCAAGIFSLFEGELILSWYLRFFR